MIPPARRRRGATAVEFALVMPILLLLAAGITTYAWSFQRKAALVDAVTEGARHGATALRPPGDPFGPAIEAAARQGVLAAAARAGWAEGAVSVTTTLGAVDGLSVVTVRASAPLWVPWATQLPVPARLESELTVATLDQPPGAF